MTEVQQAVAFLASEFQWYIDDVQNQEEMLYVEEPNGRGKYVNHEEIINIAKEQWRETNNGSLDEKYVMKIQKWYPILK